MCLVFCVLVFLEMKTKYNKADFETRLLCYLCPRGVGDETYFKIHLS